ncbi:MAG: hypothetical protein DRH50_11840 [Deltaproteobacteria bacterium]|nr:MAG: hypothetical protein DRH50_11840 [Deltaproteobacteria bacterium]
MIYDYYAFLSEQKACLKKVNECGLASGFADGCLVWSYQDKPQDKKALDPKNDARRCYMKSASDLDDLKLPPDLKFEPDFSQLPDPSWLGIEVEFKLLSPWYSKDDRPFHVLDNPVRKDRVFGVPFMSAASWKGLLRWAFKIHTGLIKLSDKELSDKDNNHFKSQEVLLFGNERREGEKFRCGTLIFYPTWFDEVGFEVINPHSRKTRTGTNPIYHEVVPAGRKGRLRLLYAPLPGEIEIDKVKPADFIDSLIDSIAALLETYGISAKRTAGWGSVDVKNCTMFLVESSWLEQNACLDGDKEYIPPEDKFAELMNEKGNPIDILLDEEEKLISKTKWRKLEDNKPCDKETFEKFREWYEKYGSGHRGRINGDKEDEQSLQIRKLTVNTLAEVKTLVGKLKDTRKGGDQ